MSPGAVRHASLRNRRARAMVAAMKTVWKFTIHPTDEQHVEMPRGAVILTASAQYDSTIQVWARVDPDAPMVKRRVRVVGTGHDASDTIDMAYVGTAKMARDALIFHVFVGGER